MRRLAAELTSIALGASAGILPQTRNDRRRKRLDRCGSLRRIDRCRADQNIFEQRERPLVLAQLRTQHLRIRELATLAGSDARQGLECVRRLDVLLAGKHEVSHTREAENIARNAGLGLRDLLWSHVARRTHDRGSKGHRNTARASDTEIGKLEDFLTADVATEHVPRSKIAVHNADGMHLFEAAR